MFLYSIDWTDYVNMHTQSASISCWNIVCAFWNIVHACWTIVCAYWNIVHACWNIVCAYWNIVCAYWNIVQMEILTDL